MREIYLVKDESVDLVFIDSPYGDNIRYNGHPLNIGHIPATDERFFNELEKVMKESYRILKKQFALSAEINHLIRRFGIVRQFSIIFTSVV